MMNTLEFKIEEVQILQYTKTLVSVYIDDKHIRDYYKAYNKSRKSKSLEFIDMSAGLEPYKFYKYIVDADCNLYGHHRIPLLQQLCDCNDNYRLITDSKKTETTVIWEEFQSVDVLWEQTTMQAFEFSIENYETEIEKLKIACISNICLNLIELNEIKDFFKEWDKYKSLVSERDKQKLLENIVEYHYKERRCNLYFKILSSIIDTMKTIDFSIDHWAPSFLSLSIHIGSKKLFDFLMRKGATINYIADKFAHETEESIAYEEQFDDRYATCLDFAEIKLADMMSTDYCFAPPEMPNDYFYNAHSDEQVTISKSEYYNLITQAVYLKDLIATDTIIYTIKELGGKTYIELKPNHKP